MDDGTSAPARGAVGESGEAPESETPPCSPRSPEEWQRLSRRIQAVARRVPILPSLSWGREVKERFLAREGRELPEITYPDRREEFAAAERLAREAAAEFAGEDPIDAWARGTFTSYADGARMLQAVGTPDFGRLSTELYGRAGDPVRAGSGAPSDLELARRILTDDPRTPVCAGLAPDDAGEERIAARPAARELQRRLREELPGERVTVTVSRGVASKAIAGNRRIRLRRGATFSAREIELLVVHEGLVHIATSLNGQAHPQLRCLGRTSPRALRLQEGLAVFAEFMAGVLDLARLRRLAERVVAIDIAQRGGDFLDVHRFFCERGQSLEEAYESARRVFRGGAPAGGGPFTKDLIYLQGLARLQQFLEAYCKQEPGSPEEADLRLLFAGKFALEDLDALRAMRAAGVLGPPRHLPAWISGPGLLAGRIAQGGPLLTNGRGRGRLSRVG